MMATGDEQVYIVKLEVDVLVVAESEDAAATDAINLLDGEAWAVAGKVVQVEEEEIWSSRLGD